MQEVIILQRVVPHYRLSLFSRLWEEFGWVVVTAKNPPANTGLSLDAREYPFIRRFEFRFPNPRKPFRCDVPLDTLLRQTGARAVIAEFSMHMNSTYLLPLQRRLRGAPITLFWSHGYNMDRGLVGLPQRLFQAPRIVLSALADGHICYSEEGGDFLARYLTRDRLFVARNTLDVAPMQAMAHETGLAEPPGRPHLLTIGRITPDKDFPRLVRVFRQFREYFPQAVLTIIGDGPDAERTRAAAGTALDDAIRMAGAVYDEEALAQYFRSADLVVFPGAVGLSVNHALAYGVPVMAFDRTPQGPNHHPEIAYVADGVTGCRIPHYTDSALLDALRGFCSRHVDPKADFKASIENYVATNLTLDVMVEDFRRVHAFLGTLGVGSA